MSDRPQQHMPASVNRSQPRAAGSPGRAAACTQLDPIDLIEPLGTTIRLQREHEIHPPGASATFCYKVLSGCVRTVRLVEDGRRQVGEFLLPGDLFGLDDLGSHPFSAEAVTGLVLRRYPVQRVEALADTHPALGRRLREIALIHLRSARERSWLLGRKTAVERLASFILEMDRRGSPDEDGLLELPMGRTDIADHLGLTVETVCRVLTQIRREGLVSISRSALRVHDRAALECLARETRH